MISTMLLLYILCTPTPLYMFNELLQAQMHLYTVYVEMISIEQVHETTAISYQLLLAI